jgi:hypothetical protein
MILLGFVLVSIISFVIGKVAMVGVLVHEKEDKRVKYAGKVYKFTFEEEESEI